MTVIQAGIQLFPYVDHISYAVDYFNIVNIIPGSTDLRNKFSA